MYPDDFNNNNIFAAMSGQSSGGQNTAYTPSSSSQSSGLKPKPGLEQYGLNPGQGPQFSGMGSPLPQMGQLPQPGSQGPANRFQQGFWQGTPTTQQPDPGSGLSAMMPQQQKSLNPFDAFGLLFEGLFTGGKGFGGQDDYGSRMQAMKSQMSGLNAKSLLGGMGGGSSGGKPNPAKQRMIFDQSTGNTSMVG